MIKRPSRTSLDSLLLDLVVFVAVILEAVFVLEGFHADVAREARRVVVVDRQVLCQT